MRIEATRVDKAAVADVSATLKIPALAPVETALTGIKDALPSTAKSDAKSDVNLAHESISRTFPEVSIPKPSSMVVERKGVGEYGDGKGSPAGCLLKDIDDNWAQGNYGPALIRIVAGVPLMAMVALSPVAEVIGTIGVVAWVAAPVCLMTHPYVSALLVVGGGVAIAGGALTGPAGAAGLHMIRRLFGDTEAGLDEANLKPGERLRSKEPESNRERLYRQRGYRDPDPTMRRRIKR